MMMTKIIILFPKYLSIGMGENKINYILYVFVDVYRKSSSEMGAVILSDLNILLRLIPLYFYVSKK